MKRFLNSRFYAPFPESFYPPVCNIQDYVEKIRYGAHIANGSQVLICALARNIKSNWVNFINRVQTIGEMFESYSVFLYENDSSDDTDVLVQRMEEWPKYKFISEKLNNKQHTNDTSYARTVDMAYYRNKYLEYVKKNYKKFDYIIILDSDLVGGYSYEGILNSLAYELDVMVSNSIIYDEYEGQKRRLFYDSWAYRRIGHPEPHDTHEINLLWYNRGEEPIKVLSAFGGMAIYKAKLFANKDLEYKAGDCDHPTLHAQLGCDIYLNPSQITLYSESYYNV